MIRLLNSFLDDNRSERDDVQQRYDCTVERHEGHYQKDGNGQSDPNEKQSVSSYG